MERQTPPSSRFRGWAADLFARQAVAAGLGLALVTLVGANFDTIQNWPVGWRISLLISVVLVVGGILARLVVAVDRGRAAQGSAPGGAEGLAGGSGSFSGVQMATPVVSGGQSPGVTPTADSESSVVIPSTPEELTELGTALRVLSNDLISLFFDFQPSPAMAVAEEKEPELSERYHRDFAYRVVYLYEEARRAGFRDREIERCYEIPRVSVFLAPLASRFGALAERVLASAGGE